MTVDALHIIMDFLTDKLAGLGADDSDTNVLLRQWRRELEDDLRALEQDAADAATGEGG